MPVRSPLWPRPDFMRSRSLSGYPLLKESLPISSRAPPRSMRYMRTRELSSDFDAVPERYVIPDLGRRRLGGGVEPGRVLVRLPVDGHVVVAGLALPGTDRVGC